MQGIYCIENIVSGGKYVGSAINVVKRIKEHQRLLRRLQHHNRHLRYAWGKYGSQAFCYYVLENVHDKDKLLDREQYYIDLLEPSYNIRRIAAGTNLGVKWSEETLEKMSEAKIGKKNSFYGKTHSPEVKAKFSKQRRGRKLTEEWKRRIGDGVRGEKNGMYGRTRSPEVCETIRQKLIGFKHSEETKEKMRRRKGSKQSSAKLNEAKAKVIKLVLSETNIPQYVLAKWYGVTGGAISVINRGIAWTHVKIDNVTYPLRPEGQARIDDEHKMGDQIMRYEDQVKNDREYLWS